MVVRVAMKNLMLRAWRITSETPSTVAYHGAMMMPELSFDDTAPEKATADLLVLGLAAGEGGPVLVAPGLSPEHHEAILEAARSVEADGAIDHTWRIPTPEGFHSKSLLLTGLGGTETNSEVLRQAAGFALQRVGSAKTVALALPAQDQEEAFSIAQGALLGAHRTAKHGVIADPTLTHIVVLGELSESLIERARISSQAVWQVRDLVAMPPNVLYPTSFVENIIELAKDLPLEVEVLDEHQLREQGFGGITAVGQGSINPPRLLVLRYAPAESTRHVALVGKGITFDSGGLSLKPANSMVGMKYDMTGAAVVAAAALAAAALGDSTAVTAWVCLAENMPSGSASRPNDVITMKGGKTVEILNTDAEGRLVLADGLQAASAENPDLIIDVATLTGAARVALGERYAGLMGTPEGVEMLEQAARVSGELVWPMPLAQELRSLLKTDVADIANAKPGNTLGGMLLAGLFLKEFVGSDSEGDLIPWAHLDIAGPAANSSQAWGYTPKGATGALTRTILQVVSPPPVTGK